MVVCGFVKKYCKVGQNKRLSGQRVRLLPLRQDA